MRIKLRKLIPYLVGYLIGVLAAGTLGLIPTPASAQPEVRYMTTTDDTPGQVDHPVTPSQGDFVEWLYTNPENARHWIETIFADDPQTLRRLTTGFDFSCPRNGWDYGWALEPFAELGRVQEACNVFRRESHGYPGEDPATITNKSGSSASGIAQFLDGTWRTWRGSVGGDRYARAKDAPVEMQVQAAANVVAHDGGWRQWSCKP